MKPSDLSKYEIARILGARALQIAMNAPLLIKITDEDLEKIKFDSLKIAEIELNSEILPISVKKPFPVKKDEELKRAKEQKVSDKKIEEAETKEEEEIAKEGEIMELVTPEDEQEENTSKEEEEK
ncbi:MAG: DNA-directed RNA polymerase subunit K [Candidatus Pacearchaeota archaeon]|jgi:DNA-directed RNA polymerase subunit K/omega|nr:DNA-directed RNA polymerase subunit K [Candidatus Pacearchaeota archaeon]|tara:strand:- start:3167 stop:3541 length:375 start_codon:yes stop_codon:yes gene_type:complete